MIDAEFIRAKVENKAYQLSLHADDERLADGLTVNQLESALLKCEIIESYLEDPRGESCLILGFVDDKPIHIVCGKNIAEQLILITVYIPRMPKWKDPRSRNR